jgi:hypothetical protein
MTLMFPLPSDGRLEHLRGRESWLLAARTVMVVQVKTSEVQGEQIGKLPHGCLVVREGGEESSRNESHRNEVPDRIRWDLRHLAIR